MPRTAREKSISEIYHVMLRGIDKRDIFIERSDYNKFLYSRLKAKEKSSFEIYAYCLMTNHVHILLKAEGEDVGSILRRICVSYVQYHNNKYGRVGHLFQNRFKSEPVNDDRYFLSVLRYIHQNPVKAGLVNKLYNYPWTSYFEYTGSSAIEVVDTEFVLKQFPGMDSFNRFVMDKSKDDCMEYREKVIYTDKRLIEVISSFSDISKIASMDSLERNIELKNIKDRTGASNRQLARVLNIGRGILDRIK